VTTAQARRDSIAKMVEERETLSVAELMTQFGVTDTSIRHDLTLLEDAGKLRRVRGGAVSRASARLTGSFPARDREHPLEKRRIGLAAAGLVQAGNVVLFDSGSTVTEIAVHIPGVLRAPQAITMVTSSLPVIQEVGTWEQPHLICLGGLYLPDYQASVGPVTLGNLRELSADIAFLGCDGLTVEGGLSTPHMLMAEVGAAMAARARRVVAVADSSKLGRAGFTPIVGLDAINVLVTDDGADAELIAQIRELGIEVVLA
jgi:DeoR/GlpR family transcriptional regulator of sugar metabolism